MKPKHLQYLENILRLMARIVLWRHRPLIIGITGSVGKTSTKEAVALVLGSKFRVRQNEKNYNNEIGIPLTIIGAESGQRSLVGWLKVLVKWLWAISFSFRYPKILVLEMGVDRPGDMRYLLSFVRPTVGIVTTIASSHLEFFKNIDHIAREKGRLLEVLPENGAAILNADDPRVLAMQERTKAPVITFGFREKAEIQASQPVFSYEHSSIQGLSFKLSSEGSVMPVRLRHILAPHLVFAALAAIGVGKYFGLNLVEITSLLSEFHPPTGRMNLIPAINRGFLIDDTYNASPVSTLSALEVMAELKAPRKIVALGDMLELGSESATGHREIGKEVAQSGIAIFLAVGSRMQDAVLSALENGFPREHIFHFADPISAGEKLHSLVREGDLVLIKGSQGMRMEKVAEKIVAKEINPVEVLCRQSADWRKKAFAKP